ncbi:MAG TPA: tetratricopeptide repeat protein, partial [Promineifilum sp.]
VGDAGLGKSRLLYEFENWVDLQPVKVQLYRGRAWMETQKLPYGLLRNVFVFRCGIHDDDANPVVRDKLVSAFQGVLGEGLETTRKAHIVGHLIGYDFGTSPYVQPFIGDARQLRSQAMFYLTEFFRAASARGPILFLFEDLHWADDSSLDAIASLEATSAVGQTMILSAARPTLYERRPDWLAYRPGHQRIGLAALDPQASSELVSEVLQKADLIPESLRQLIIARSEGNPYYVEELVKVLVDEGVIVVDGDSWRVNPNRVMSVRVPATLTGLLQSRLENLPEDERGALQRASVVGRLFWDDAVRSVGDEPNDGSLADQMASLQRRELVYLREETAFEGANEFLFKHAMLRDVTYESVLKRLRRVYHRRAAEWLAVRAGDRAEEYADQIAAHYAEAGDELSEAQWQGRAGKQAARRYATNEAIRALSRALELTPQEDRASRYELLENRCQTFHLLGDRTRQLADLEELERLASEMGEPRRMIQAAASKSMYLLSTGDYEQVLANHRTADQWLDRADVPSLKAQLHKHSAHALVYLGQYDEAKRYLSLVVELAEEIGDKRTLMDALRVLGIVAEELGDFGAEQKYFLDALQLARELGDRMGERRALNSLGIVAQNIGDYQAALAYYVESLDIARAIGDRTGEGTVLGNIGVMKNHIGDYSGACEMFRQSLAIDGETGNKTGVNVNLLNLAAALTYLEDYDTSLDLLQQAYDGIEKTGDLPLLGHVLNARGMTLLRAGRSKEALATLRRALDLRMTLGQPHLAIETRALLAESLLQEGYHAEAVAEAETVLLYREENQLLEEASVSWVMMAVYHVLEAAGDERSAEVLARAHEELQLSADQLDPVSRQSYLQNVAANREIAELWQNRSGK